MKLWAGRFSKPTDHRLDDFQSSLSFDIRLLPYDARGSIAHARMLGKQGILPPEDVDAIVAGLEALLEEAERGTLVVDADAEDVHMFVEAWLTRRIGDAGKRLHTGRSRNDQVALDVRMFALDACAQVTARLKALLNVIVSIADAHTGDPMPGYTHMQKAQPITLSHHMMAYAQMFLRDAKRFAFARSQADVMPLGSGALAGTTYPLDRAYVAEQLGFSAITENALDGVSDRDFLLDFLSAASACMMHLSRFCEEMILWSTGEFHFAVMDDSFSTGSSIMPQKKNPDAAELVRGKTGRVYGDLTALLNVMKGLPLAYNKDMQEDKEAFFDAFDTVMKCLDVFTGMLETTAFQTGDMKKAALNGFTNATDLADYLVTKGVPFRDAHAVSGKLVAYCIKADCSLLDLPLETLQAAHPAFDADVFDAISLEACVNRRSLTGGPAAVAVRESIDHARAAIDKL